MEFDLLHPSEQLVMIMDRIYKGGMTTTSGGNLSIMDDNGDIWITPAGIDKGTLTIKDIVQVKPDGAVIGQHRPSSELPFHQATYAGRPDVKAVLHAHPPALVSFSIVRKIPNTCLIPNASIICGEVGLAEYGLPGSTDLGDKIGRVFKKGIKTVLLENHGCVVVGKSLFEAFMTFETLDFCARLEIEANRLGTPVTLSGEQLETAMKKQHTDMKEFTPTGYSSKEKEARREMCELIHRAYDQQLFTSTQGTFSIKLSDDSFIITPYMVDRKYIGIGDIVRIENGCREAGKTPSRSVPLHQEIYRKNRDVNSVIIAHPHNIMAFAVTAEKFDSRTIPESYILIRNLNKLPFGMNFLQPAQVAEMLVASNPMVLVENECVIATGSSLLNAFDRLEVLEYSAKALIAAKSLGEPVLIDDEKIADLEVAFNLPKIAKKA
ncbi:MAG: class II aldolase/adducin family protein [Clostridiales bacterium]|nr:class II aldolase/adducin family protein [Clostridiales bacterium]